MKNAQTELVIGLIWAAFGAVAVFLPGRLGDKLFAKCGKSEDQIRAGGR